jgi:hypothetical protein
MDIGLASLGLDESYRVFISEDPIRLNGGSINLYSYVNNNSVNFTDPSGLAPPLGGPFWPPIGPPSSCIGGCHPPKQPSKRGDTCYKADCIAKCMYIDATPGNTWPCWLCTYMGGGPFCWACGGGYLINLPDCYLKCKGKINSCGQCQ